MPCLCGQTGTFGWTDCRVCVDRPPCLCGQTGTFGWTDHLVCVDRLAHLGVQAWCLTKTNFTKTSKSLQLYLQQMCIEAEELLPGDSHAIFRPMDIDESARPLEGCVLSVRYGVFLFCFYFILLLSLSLSVILLLFVLSCLLLFFL